MAHFDPSDQNVVDTYRLLVAGIGPRPIALVSTLSKEGINNLAPFSYFNVFSIDPPIVGFSPLRRMRDASLKHTYLNISQTKECTIGVVTRSMVDQINLTSTEFGTGVDEFIKSGLTPLDSDVVSPRRVKESPFQMECKLHQMVSFGEKPGAGNLALCEIVRIHFDEDLMVDGLIDPNRIDLVGRMGGSYYARAHGDALFEVNKPGAANCVGYDRLPKLIKQSLVLHANDLARLASVEKLPEIKEIQAVFQILSPISEPNEEMFIRFEREKHHKGMMEVILGMDKDSPSQYFNFLERTAKVAIGQDDVLFAWSVLLFGMDQK